MMSTLIRIQVRGTGRINFSFYHYSYSHFLPENKTRAASGCHGKSTNESCLVVGHSPERRGRGLVVGGAPSRKYSTSSLKLMRATQVKSRQKGGEQDKKR